MNKAHKRIWLAALVSALTVIDFAYLMNFRGYKTYCRNFFCVSYDDIDSIFPLVIIILFKYFVLTIILYMAIQFIGFFITKFFGLKRHL